MIEMFSFFLEMFFFWYQILVSLALAIVPFLSSDDRMLSDQCGSFQQHQAFCWHHSLLLQQFCDVNRHWKGGANLIVWFEDRAQSENNAISE